MLSAEFSVNGNSNVTEHLVAYAGSVSLQALSTSFRTISWEIVSSSKSGLTTPTLTLGGAPLGVTASFNQVADPGDGLGRTWVVRCTQTDSAGNSVSAYRVIGTLNTAGRLPICADEYAYRNATHGWCEVVNDALRGVGGGVSAHSALTGLTTGDDHTQYELARRPPVTYTLASNDAALADARKCILTNRSSAIALRIRTQANIAWLTDSLLGGINIGSGTLTLTAEAGVTLNGSVTIAQNGWWWAKRIAADTWQIFTGGSSGGTGDFVGPGSSTSGNLTSFGDGTGKLGADSGIRATDVITRTSLRARAIATSNVSSLSGLAQTFDGIALNADGQVIFLSAQADPKQNGPWVVHSGAWTRPTWFATGLDVSNAIIIVQKGTTYADTGWLCTTDTTAIVGTDNLDFKGIFGANLDGTSIVLSGNTIVRGGITGDVLIPQGSNGATINSGVIVNANVNAAAAIAGTKISPDFGSQDIVTTGALKLNNSGGFVRLGLANGSGSGVASAASTGGIRLPRGNTSQAAIYGRNNADTGDYLALQWDSVTPRLILGDTTAGGTAIYLQSSLGQLRQGTNAVFDWTSTKLQPRLSLSWVATAATPLISQDDAAGTSATGEKMTIRAQSGTGGSSIGGDLDVGPGAGTTRGGLFRLMAGGTTPGGGAVRLSFNDTGWAWDGVTPIAQPSRVGQLTDSTTGSASSTVSDVGSSFSQSAINNNFASVLNRINGIEAIIHNRGISA